VLSRVPHGSILGPLLFVIYVNDMPNYLTSNWNLTLFADDSKLYSLLRLSILNTNYKVIFIDHSMPFKLILQMSRKWLPSNFTYNYQLENHQLVCVTNITDLGITISNNSSWELHIEKICAKASKILGLVKCVCDIIEIRIHKLLQTTFH
jgi:hypothetical protein